MTKATKSMPLLLEEYSVDLRTRRQTFTSGRFNNNLRRFTNSYTVKRYKCTLDRAIGIY